MELFAAKKRGEKDFKIDEIVISCTLEDIEKIISFLTYARDSLYQEKILPHNDVIKLDKKIIYPHCHYRDWDLNWKEKNPDIILITPLQAVLKENGETEWVDIENE